MPEANFHGRQAEVVTTVALVNSTIMIPTKGKKASS
jgi:hypothetical protein